MMSLVLYHPRGRDTGGEEITYRRHNFQISSSLAYTNLIVPN